MTGAMQFLHLPREESSMSRIHIQHGVSHNWSMSAGFHHTILSDEYSV